MHNIFFLVIDAFCYDNLERKIGDKYTCPFLRELSSIYPHTDYMYTQAPYTEASLVSILSGENTLENGGYIYGNKNVESTVFAKFKKQGYKIISQYAPYVYSKSYLRDVDLYYYTRLINVEVLFEYRLKYFLDKKRKGTIVEDDYRICIELVEEELDTWIRQASSLLANDEECILIQPWVEKLNVSKCLERIIDENIKFCSNKMLYLDDLFLRFDNHVLREINKVYNRRRPLPNREDITDEFQILFEKAQSKYSKLIKKNKVDFKYILNTLINNKDGIKDFKGLIHNYMRLYRNHYLDGYLDSIDENAKDEVCMDRQFDYVIEKVDEANSSGDSTLSYLHVQDFHLPTVIHSVDSENRIKIVNELKQALDFFGNIDSNYEGNIIADLGAYFCDCKVREFYGRLIHKYKDNFTLVVTADHGYPSYFNPPRPIIYNQTYTEAFHVPYIVTNKDISISNDAIYSSMDFFAFIDSTAKSVKPRKYIISEYGGPGCPFIGTKPIWYTYIDKNFRVSVEVSLEDDVSLDKIKSVYFVKDDTKEKHNLVRNLKRIKEINIIIELIRERHHYLSEKYKAEKFSTFLLS